MIAIASHYIQQAWRARQAPMVDGILFRAGWLFPVEYYSLASRGVVGVGARVSATIASLIDVPHELLTLDELAACSDPIHDVRYTCGEGSFGGDGFVACAGATSHELEWIALFQQSNLFVGLTLSPDRVEATNSHGHVWTFPRADPIGFEVG